MSDVVSLVASLLAVTITGGIGWATHKSAQKAADRNVTVQSRTDIEREAFERAKGYYTDTIDRQARDLGDVEKELGRVKQEMVAQGERHEAERKRQESRHEAQMREVRQELEVVKTGWRRCQTLLRARFPDEDPQHFDGGQ